MGKHYTAAIIGGGSAGLCAAVFLARRGVDVIVFEKAARVGRKLIATGNGTCNITNLHADENYYHGAPASFVKTVLQRFSPQDALRFFSTIGVECTVRENGRVYPLCGQASAVLDCLRLELDSLGVEEHCGEAAMEVQKRGNNFTLRTNADDYTCRNLLVCAGGAASPSLGGGNDGYSLLISMGHTKTPLFPSVVQVKTDTAFVKAVKGIRVDGEICWQLNGKKTESQRGEILFTEYGISGPAVMQISRLVGDWERRKKGELTACINLLPDYAENELISLLSDRLRLNGSDQRTTEDYLTGLLNKRVGQTIVRVAEIPLTKLCRDLTQQEVLRIARIIQNWQIPVTGTQGMGGAQVTAGGITATEFDPTTLMSRLVPGLFAAGEVLDVDGDCGGFNLQWAWASAFTAANAIGELV